MGALLEFGVRNFPPVANVTGSPGGINAVAENILSPSKCKIGFGICKYKIRIGITREVPDPSTPKRGAYIDNAPIL